MGNLGDVKAGDEIYVVTMLGWEPHYQTATVERTTATQIIVNGNRYRRQDGYGVGDKRARYLADFLLPITDETRKEAEEIMARQAEERRRNGLMGKIRNTILRDLSTAALERIAAIIEAEREEEPHA